MVSLHDILLYYFFLMAGDMSQIATPIADEVASYGVVDESVIAILRAREVAGELSIADPEVQELLVQARGAVVDMKEAELQEIQEKQKVLELAKNLGNKLQHDFYTNVEGVQKNDEDQAAKDVLASW